MPQTKRGKEKLQRSLGFTSALAIGIGTMVGAGIFVFPGIAIGYAGPAAMASFAIAGLIALLVAFSTAELATAMPENGGAYYFVSRAMGNRFGIFVGIGQWFGLVFASSFYLVGFGQYLVEFMNELGLSPGNPYVLIAAAGGVFLTLLNIAGTKKVGNFQNGIVVTLTVILGLMFAYGILENMGITGYRQPLGVFAPNGTWPVFTTAALIFTSFLGFVQIATVAGEIKKPHKNLPRALVVSVLIVTALYVIAIFVTSTSLPASQLSGLGENAMIEVAEEIIGDFGGMIVLLAALMATLSSANASVLSSSRAVYALSKDKMISQFAAKVHDNFGTPHISVLLVGIPITLFTLLGRLEVLAEVASLLHLIFYGLICVSLVMLQKEKPLWYAPAYSVPGGRLIPVMGSITSFGLIFLMQTLSMLIGFSILILSAGWYFLYARQVKIPEPVPPHIIPKLREPHILMTAELPSPDPPPLSLFRAFKSLNLFVLGYVESPEQTSPQQSQQEEGEEAREAFEEYLDHLSFKNINIDYELAYTSNYSDTLSSFITEQEVHALLIPAEMKVLNRLLIPIYRQDQINTRMATILRELSESSRLPVSLIFLDHKDKNDENILSLDELEFQTRNLLQRTGIQSTQIKTKSISVDSITDSVVQISSADDLIIISESELDKRERWFSSLHDKIQSEVKCPVLLIFQEKEKSKTDKTVKEKAEEVVSD